jgi:hypothetical protein
MTDILKSYIFVYSAELGTRDEVKHWLDSMRSIIRWRYDLPNCFYLVSHESAQFISEEIRKKKESGRFLITEVDSNNYYGWLTNESWHLIQTKNYKPNDK